MAHPRSVALKSATILVATVILCLSSCHLFYQDFPDELQGRWEYDDGSHYEWFVIDRDELYYCKCRINYGTIEDERTMYLRSCDESAGQLSTTDLYVLYRWEGNQLSFAYGEDGFPSSPEWKDVHPY